MGTRRREFISLFCGAAVAILAVGVATEAAALSFKDISGKWCSEAGDYNFSRNTLVARFHDGTPTRRLKVTSYEYTGETVTMYWLYKGEKLYTEFSEFSADGRTMAQLKGESGLRGRFIVADAVSRSCHL